ncbi:MULTISPECIES: zinc-dependent alcohol dehydrogenase [unclassified Rathayibacter]|jgi:threonine dehydrogenase-like Zn-dependent dehydrogenase|uniref:zinc-dependent alcohol dehydrogenase n=1 Tax=unclassified Rathayibacter TaxID=2609250 RepID=UPI000CE8762C|nr:MULTISPECIES: zinc-dependent alcohol dehydrogenase [unclassified Rathayibacter]PPF11246.1 glutathione-dependent formaldehyde dehydrogenase [Rathayibacter sp. AY1A5]PPF20022.1 glutathione-dependent formaldehyde dehydrogenase [Rathayibacter sp. AY1A7]PPF49599.1 glutathione-dependent formaldehyde dehydrogenase [Rathayibacter sp. AY1A1]PPF53487.1 glutathione-dependent formaldehyde dehydrogenase [Rathayibacter sp. AY1C2]PPF73020.1 glutathione-dependent formaldehyde dehydrogenase [Rathayibacter s
MRALTWQGIEKVSVETVPDPRIQQPTDAIVRITSTAICGSDLHLYRLLGPYIDRGDVLGHEPMGVVEEVGSGVTTLKPGDRVVVPFTIACGECFMCRRGLQSQCETTQVTEYGSGAALFGYTKMYGQVPGGQAELLRVPLADYNTIVVGTDLPDERYLFLSDIVPTAWQGVEYAQVPDGGTLVVFGLGPVGQFAARIGAHRGYRVLAVEPVAERRAMAERYGVETFDLSDDIAAQLRDLTDGRGPDSVVDAVGMEAHGSPVGSFAQSMAGLLPDPIARKAMDTVGVDRLAAVHASLDLVRRGGTVSLSGVYGGEADPMPLKSMFDKQVTVRMGQCNVKRWIDDLLPLVEDSSDPLGVMDLVTHRAPLEDAPALYETFQKKEDGCIKVVLHP